MHPILPSLLLPIYPKAGVVAREGALLQASLVVPEEDMFRLFALKMEDHEGLTRAAI